MKNWFIITLILSVAVSCTKDDIGTVSDETGEMVEVPLSLRISGETSGTPTVDIPLTDRTRAIDDPESDNGASAEIANLWVLQYNGTSDAAVLVGVPTYFDAYSELEEEKQTVKLISSSADNTIVFLANTCDPSLLFPQGSTLADLKSRVKRIAQQSDLFGSASTTGEGDFPDNGDFRTMLNGIVHTTISSDMEAVGCTLRRNIARIDLAIDVADDAGIRIETVELRSVPAVSHYITAYDELPENFPTAGSFQTVSFTAPAETIDNGDGRTTYRFYTAANMRGTIDNANQAYKNRYAPTSATYAFVQGSYSEGGVELPVSYSFYLGANLENDFNLKPNCKYTYDIEIRAKGDAQNDTRIDDWGTVDYSAADRERANCYILNPAPVDDYKRRFRIPVDRIDVFWGDNGYEAMNNYLLGNSIGWSAEVVWADFDYAAAGIEITKSSGSGANDYFEIAVPRDIAGNMVIGVRQPGKTAILWSWHLWITDYRPDEGLRYSPEPDRYVYSVSGGALHRYAGSAWTSGIYADRFIMDRNVGAVSDGYAGSGFGSLYYQFGRKDPFPGSATLYGAEGETPAVRYVKISDANGGDPSTVVYSVQNPLRFITNSGLSIDGTTVYCWTYGDKYNPATYNSSIIWQDPLATTREKDLPKSIFDPCPPGWCLPRDGVWGDFRTNTATEPTTNINGGTEPLRGFTPYSQSGAIGLRYWPYPGSGDSAVSEEIYYPASGYRNYSSGALTNVGGYGYYWSGTPNSQSNGRHLYFNSSYVSPSNNYSRANGFPVRCVRE